MTESALDAAWVRRCRAGLMVAEDRGVPRADCLGTLRAALFVHVLRVVDTPDVRAFRDQEVCPPPLTPEERAEAERGSMSRFVLLGEPVGARFIVAVLWDEAHDGGYDDDGTLNLLWRSFDAAAAERLVDGGL